MPEKNTLERARKAEREGKAPSTQAGESVREEIKHIREGKHGARSTKQAIAIGLSKARRAGVKLRPAILRRTSLKDIIFSPVPGLLKGENPRMFDRSIGRDAPTAVFFRAQESCETGRGVKARETGFAAQPVCCATQSIANFTISSDSRNPSFSLI